MLIYALAYAYGCLRLVPFYDVSYEKRQQTFIYLDNMYFKITNFAPGYQKMTLIMCDGVFIKVRCHIHFRDESFHF